MNGVQTQLKQQMEMIKEMQVVREADEQVQHEADLQVIRYMADTFCVIKLNVLINQK